MWLHLSMILVKNVFLLTEKLIILSRYDFRKRVSDVLEVAMSRVTILSLSSAAASEGRCQQVDYLVSGECWMQSSPPGWFTASLVWRCGDAVIDWSPHILIYFSDFEPPSPSALHTTQLGCQIHSFLFLFSYVAIDALKATIKSVVFKMHYD